MIRRRIVFLGSLVVLFTLGWWVGRGRATGDLYSGVDLFVEIIHKVEDSYVDTVDPARLVEGAIRGLVRTLDAHSQYLDADAYAHLKDDTHGEFGGIGIVVSVRDNFPTVISPIEGSPAWKAGLRSGDAIVKIGSRSSMGMSVEDAATLLRGTPGSAVRLTVRRVGESEDQEYSLIREEIVTKSVPYAFVTDDHVGYLRLANFSEKAGADVRAALQRLRHAGARSVIVDERMNPGGLLDQAVDVAEQFLPDQTLIVYTQGRARGQNRRYYASEPRSETRWPMVVLVDEGSASASEIVAGALQDRDRALVVGHTTFGKGSVQSLFPLPGRASALKLTTALYYTPSGRSIHRRDRDSLSAELEDDEDAGDGEPDSLGAAADSAARPLYHTLGGRPVYGGGGVAPDVAVSADSLPPLTRTVEQRGLGFDFANRWAGRHPGATLEGASGEAVWGDFTGFLRDHQIAFEAADLRRERPDLERTLRRELARRLVGDSAAVRVALAADPVFQRAVEILKRARSAADVFAAAGVERPGREPSDRAGSARPARSRSGPAPDGSRSPGDSR